MYKYFRYSATKHKIVLQRNYQSISSCKTAHYTQLLGVYLCIYLLKIYNMICLCVIFMELKSDVRNFAVDNNFKLIVIDFKEQSVVVVFQGGEIAMMRLRF